MEISNEQFDAILAGIMNESPAASLLSIPGVYEAVSEHFNNDVLSRWEETCADTTCECGGIGLDVFNGREIQRCDLCKVYPSDEAAAAAVHEAIKSYPELFGAPKKEQPDNERRIGMTTPGRLDDLIEALVAMSDRHGPDCVVRLDPPLGDWVDVSSVTAKRDEDAWTTVIHIHADH